MSVGLRFLAFCFLMLSIFDACPKTIGADSLVSVEPLTIVPAVDSTPNQILQFAFMQNGFTFQDATTSCTFGAVFPVAGPVNVSGGTIYLNTDLIFQNPANIISTGYFWGNNHQMDLSESISWLSSTFQSQFRDTSVFLNTDFTIAGTVKFLGSCLIDGRGNTITLGQNANLMIGHNAQLTLRNIELNDVFGHNIACLDDSASLILDNVRFVQSADYTFTQGSISFVNNVDVVGQHVFNFSSGLTSTIQTDSILYFDIGTTLNYSPSSPNKTLLYMNDQTSFLYLNGCSLLATRTGLELSQGTLIIDNHVTVSSQALFLAEGIQFDSTLNTLLLGSARLDLYGIIVAN